MAVQILSNPMFTWAPQGVDPTGMLLFTYAADSSTKKKTWVDTAKSAEHTNPIVLNNKGQPNNGSPVVIDGSYKFVLAPANDTDPPASGTVIADNYSSDLTPSVSGNFNLANNGSFEDDTNGDGTPDSWVIAELTSGSIATDNTSQAHGLNSLSFTSGGSGGGTATSEDYIEVLAGGKYNGVLSIISSAVDTHNLMEVYWYTSSKVYISKSSVYDEAAANPLTWTQYNTTITAPATAVYAKVVLTGVAADSTTIASSTKTRFDDVKLQDVSGTYSDSAVNADSVGTLSSGNLDALEALSTSEIQTLDASVQAVTGFTYSNIFHVDDDGDSQNENSFDVSTNISTSWESIGPTGSGADNIWTALDALPSNAKYVVVRLYSDLINTSSGSLDRYILARRNGGSASATTSGGTAKTISYKFTSFSGSITAAHERMIDEVMIPVSSRKFDLYRNFNIGTSETCNMFLVGFGV